MKIYLVLDGIIISKLLMPKAALKDISSYDKDEIEEDNIFSHPILFGKPSLDDEINYFDCLDEYDNRKTNVSLAEVRSLFLPIPTILDITKNIPFYEMARGVGEMPIRIYISNNKHDF